MGAASALGVAPELLRASSDVKASSQPESEYLLEPGAAFLNTGTLGLTPRVVLDRVVEVWRELEANPVFTVYGASPIRDLPDQVRAKAADFLGCSLDELMITRSTTDAMNHIAQGLVLGRGDRVLTTDQEHGGGTACWEYVARRRGVVIDRIHIAPTDLSVQAIVQRFADAITKQTKVISVSHILCTNGHRMPVAEISKVARDRGIVCVVDGAQALGGTDVNVKSIGCHAYAASGHKWLLGPKGTGFLYVSKESQEEIAPIEWQDGKNYIDEATGVGSIPLIAGLGVAIELAKTRGVSKIEAHNVALRNRLYEGLLRIPKVKAMSAPPGEMATALIGLAIPDEFDARKFASTLREKHGVTVRLATKSWYNGIRLSPHIFNTEEHVDRALAAIKAELA